MATPMLIRKYNTLWEGIVSLIKQLECLISSEVGCLDDENG